jgi:hypothetical protein
MCSNRWGDLGRLMCGAKRLVTGEAELMASAVNSENEDAGEALARLVMELGRAAHTGWGPSLRWLAFLAVAAGALALVLIASG